MSRRPILVALAFLTLLLLGVIAWSWWLRHPAGPLDDLGTDAGGVLRTLPGVVAVRRDGPWGKPSRRIVHVLNWHFLPHNLLALDLRAQRPGIDDAGVAKAYREHLVEVEAVQAEQQELLEVLARDHRLTVVMAEGLTPQAMPAWQEHLAWLREAEADRPRLLELANEGRRLGRPDLARQAEKMLDEAQARWLELGVPGWLAARDLAEVLPLDEPETMNAAAPRRTGGKVDAVKVRAREAAMVRRVMEGERPVVVLVLSGAHDLAGEVRRQGDGSVEYLRVATRRYREAAGE
jgi:hypothetical protein